MDLCLGANTSPFLIEAGNRSLLGNEHPVPPLQPCTRFLASHIIQSPAASKALWVGQVKIWKYYCLWL